MPVHPTLEAPPPPPLGRLIFALGHLQKIFFPVFQTLLTIRQGHPFCIFIRLIIQIVLKNRLLCLIVVYLCGIILIFAPDNKSFQDGRKERSRLRL